MWMAGKTFIDVCHTGAVRDLWLILSIIKQSRSCLWCCVKRVKSNGEADDADSGDKW